MNLIIKKAISKKHFSLSLFNMNKKYLTVDGAANVIGGGGGPLKSENVADPAASLRCSSGVMDLL